MIRGWLQRLRMKRELRFLMKMQGLEYLAMTTEELIMYNARKKLEKPFRAYVRRKRLMKLRHRMSIRIQTAWRAYRERAYSYISAFQLD